MISAHTGSPRGRFLLFVGAQGAADTIFATLNYNSPAAASFAYRLSVCEQIISGKHLDKKNVLPGLDGQDLLEVFANMFSIHSNLLEEELVMYQIVMVNTFLEEEMSTSK